MAITKTISLTKQHEAWLEAQKTKGNRQNLSHILRAAIQRMIDEEEGIVSSNSDLRDENELLKEKVARLADHMHKIWQAADDAKVKSAVYKHYEKLNSRSITS